jgi:hypothetical protein
MIEKSKDVTHETRPPACNPGPLPGDTEVLTWETCSQQFDVRDGLQALNVVMQLHVRKSRA